MSWWKVALFMFSLEVDLLRGKKKRKKDRRFQLSFFHPPICQFFSVSFSISSCPLSRFLPYLDNSFFRKNGASEDRMLRCGDGGSHCLRRRASVARLLHPGGQIFLTAGRMLNLRTLYLLGISSLASLHLFWLTPRPITHCTPRQRID